MRPTVPLLALALATSGCHVARSESVSQMARAREIVSDSLPRGHPSKGPLLIYATRLNETLRDPEDTAMVRATLAATNCLGLMPAGHLPSDTRHAIDAALISSPARESAYRRYVVRSSSIALTREEVECREQ
jgi:hypothetical protein